MIPCWPCSCASGTPSVRSYEHDANSTPHSLGYIISAVFICAEYQLLGKHFREYRILRTSFWIKLAFIFVELGLAIAFGVTEYKGALNVSGYLEWIVSLVYIFYVWSVSHNQPRWMRPERH